MSSEYESYESILRRVREQIAEEQAATQIPYKTNLEGGDTLGWETEDDPSAPAEDPIFLSKPTPQPSTETASQEQISWNHDELNALFYKELEKSAMLVELECLGTTDLDQVKQHLAQMMGLEHS